MTNMNKSGFSYNDLAFSWQGGMAHAVEVFNTNGDTVAMVSNTKIGGKEGSYYCIGCPSDLKNIPELSDLSKLDDSVHYAFLMKHLPIHPRNSRLLQKYYRMTGVLSDPKSTVKRKCGYRTDTPLRMCFDVVVENPKYTFRVLRIDNEPAVISGSQVNWGMAALHGKKVPVENFTPGQNKLILLSAYNRAYGQ